MYKINVGDHVIFTDSKGQDHNALVLCDWGRCINVVYVSSDESKQDQYGRQIERGATSVCHVADSTVHGYYFRLPNEEKRPYTPPVQS